MLALMHLRDFRAAKPKSSACKQPYRLVDDEDDDDDDDFDESIFDDEVSQEDFDGDTFKARTLKAWATTPPMTQAYVGASLGLTAFSFMACNNQWPEMLHLNWGAVLKRAQLW